MKKLTAIVLLVALIGLIGLSCSAENNQNKQKVKNPISFNTGGILDVSADAAAKLVTIKDNSFQPSTLTVPAGTTVTWNNQDNVQHTVTSDEQGLFDSGKIAPGKNFQVLFSNPGSYNYHSSLQQGMQGVIVVTGASSDQGILLESGPSGASGSKGSKITASWSEMPMVQSESTANAGTSQGAQGSIQTKKLQLNLQTGSSQIISPATYQGPGQDSGQAIDQSAFEQFSQYYRSTSEAPKDQVTAPTKFDLKGSEPAMLYFGSAQKAIPYSQYKSYATSTGINSLWIRGTNSWSQYAVVPLGSVLTLTAISPAGGLGYLYEIYPDDTLDAKSHSFYAYNQIDFYADQVGQHQLFFNIGGQPSNVIAIDVEPYQQPIYSFSSVTVASSWLRGYAVYVDGNYVATEGMNGGSQGFVTFSVTGNQYHTIAVYGSGFSFSDSKYFGAGNAYQLNV
ncbi:Plastocyanin [uncultured archaeon]|nr:Plastocyanin [uncultured archaeon]